MSDKVKDKSVKETKPLTNYEVQEAIRIAKNERKRSEEMGAMHKYDRWKYDKNNS